MKTPDKSLLFATAFCHVSGRAPNARTIFERSKLYMYYQCMIVCYASIRRLYPEAQLALFTNRVLPDPFNMHLKSLRVDTVICASRYVDDLAFKNDFPGCFFSLDVIEQLARSQSFGFSHLVLMDSDCIIRHRLDTMVDELTSNEESIYAYEMGYPVNMVINGQSRASLTLALSYFSGQLVACPIISHYGGEFYSIPSSALPKLAKRIDDFWDWMKSEGIKSFGCNLTEEHVMSVVLAELGNTVNNARGLIKRIWTTVIYSSVDGSESGIPVWHLPSEKRRGFVKLYRYWVANNGFAALSDRDFRDLVDKTVSLRKGGQKYPGRSLLLRARNAVKVLVTGRL
ncbi:MAG TPA: hypothetical protein VLX29_00200 [Nitrospirota bacterium]|nr:hypothetical protein [Nitrospirota bacterium]